MEKPETDHKPFPTRLTDAAFWRIARRNNLSMARVTRALLIAPHGHWHLSADDARVKAAVGAWVERSRNAHAIAMGRRAVIENFSYADSNGFSASGQLYAKPFRPQPMPPHHPNTLEAMGIEV